MTTDYKKIYAIQKKNEERIKKICPEADNSSGIYMFYRGSEEGIKYAYIGQASKSLLARTAQHLSGYQHIDLSIKKHGFYDTETNPYGYKIGILKFCPVEELDYWEQYFIKMYAGQGFQLRNKTIGGQGKGKTGMNENKPARGYRDGVKQGEKNIKRKLSELIDKYLVVSTRTDSKLAQNALKKFNDLLSDDE